MRFTTESRTGSRRLRLPFVIGLFALVLVSPVLTLLEADSVAWVALAVGTLAFGVASAALTWTDVGEAAVEWFDRIGVVGRALVIVSFAAVVWTTMWLGAWPASHVATSSFVVRDARRPRRRPGRPVAGPERERTVSSAVAGSSPSASAFADHSEFAQFPEQLAAVLLVGDDALAL